MDKNQLVHKLRDIEFIKRPNEINKGSEWKQFLRIYLQYPNYEIMANILSKETSYISNEIPKISREIIKFIGVREINHFLPNKLKLEIQDESKDPKFGSQGTKAILYLKEYLEEALSESASN